VYGEHSPLKQWVNGQLWYGRPWLQKLPPIDLLVVDVHLSLAEAPPWPHAVVIRGGEWAAELRTGGQR
jgi:hypothetical protein